LGVDGLGLWFGFMVWVYGLGLWFWIYSLGVRFRVYILRLCVLTIAPDRVKQLRKGGAGGKGVMCDACIHAHPH